MDALVFTSTVSGHRLARRIGNRWRRGLTLSIRVRSGISVMIAKPRPVQKSGLRDRLVVRR